MMFSKNQKVMNVNTIRKNRERNSLNDSPLYHVKSTLKYLRMFLGFPIVSTNDYWNEFIFTPVKEYVRLSIFLFLCLVPLAIGAFVFSNHLEDFKLMFKLSNLDIIVEGIMVQWLPFSSSILYFFTFKNKHKKLEKICKKISAVNHYQSIAHGHTTIYKNAKEKANRFLKYSFLLGCLSCLFQVLSIYMGFSRYTPQFMSTELIWTTSIFGIIQFWFGLMAPMIYAGDFIVIYIINHLSQNIIFLKKELKRVVTKDIGLVQNVGKSLGRNDCDSNEKVNRFYEKEQNGLSNLKDVEHILDAGLDICNATKTFNRAFSCIIFCSFAGNLVCATSTFYVSFHCMFLRQLSPSRFWFGLKSISLVLLLTFKLYVLTTSSHQLGRNMKTLGRRFDKIMVSLEETCKATVEAIENQALEKKVSLLKTFVDSDSPISPFGYFSINGGTFLSAMATVLTYLIVLIQFKMAEESNDHRNETLSE